MRLALPLVVLLVLVMALIGVLDPTGVFGGRGPRTVSPEERQMWRDTAGMNEREVREYLAGRERDRRLEADSKFFDEQGKAADHETLSAMLDKVFERDPQLRSIREADPEYQRKMEAAKRERGERALRGLDTAPDQHLRPLLSLPDVGIRIDDPPRLFLPPGAQQSELGTGKEVKSRESTIEKNRGGLLNVSGEL